MRIAIIYVYPKVNTARYRAAAQRFVNSYQKNPPGERPHSIHVAVNGGKLVRSDELLFEGLPVTFFSHDNYGKDIGAFQKAAREIDCDLMIFMGSHIHFRKPGWLDLIALAFEQNGPGMYGAYAFHTPSLHIRTTSFWMPPNLLNAYPLNVGSPHRYEFEHGSKHGVAKWVINSGFSAWMLTWKGVFPPSEWHHVENKDALFLDQHSDTIGYT